MSQVVKIEFPDALRKYGEASKEFKDGFMRRLGTYANYIVQYIKREKLSGQVLCKYANVYDSLFGQKSDRFAATKKGGVYRGKLYNTFGAQVYNDPSIQFFETIYGKAWEGGENGEGWSRKAYTIRPKAWRNPKTARLMFYAGGAWRFAKKVHIPAMSFPAKPHIRTSIHEPEPVKRFYSLVFRPFAKYISGGLS